MEDKQKSKIITLSACLVIMTASVFVLFNQIKLNREITEIKASMTENIVINWADEDNNANDKNITNNYKVNMQENITFSDSESTENNTETVLNEGTVTTQSLSGYIVNTNSKKIHSPDCSSAARMSAKNKKVISGSEFSEYISNGYTICSVCNAGE